MKIITVDNQENWSSIRACLQGVAIKIWRIIVMALLLLLSSAILALLILMLFVART